MIEVPRGSIMHELLDEGPAAIGAEIDNLTRRCKAMDVSFGSKLRKLLLPDAMMASDSSCSDEPEPSHAGFKSVLTAVSSNAHAQGLCISGCCKITVVRR